LKAPGKPFLPRFFLNLGLCCAVFLVVVFWLGRDYYLLPAADRPLDPRHSGLRPSGRIGLLMAITGTVFIFLNLTYLARKRLKLLRNLGPLRSWMGFHVFTGLIGPALIVLHSALAPRSALGILSFSALLIVVITGIVGRYIYARVPRSMEGHELQYEEIRKRLGSYRSDLEALGVDLSPLSLQTPPAAKGGKEGFLATLAGISRGDSRRRLEYGMLRRAVLSSKSLRPRASRILPLVRRLVRERMWLHRYHELRSLMGSWRFFHRWIALLMLLVVLFHILVAIWFGDLWILRGEW